MAAPLDIGGVREREDHQALLARWVFSNRKRGEIVIFESWEKPSYRKLVNAVSRIARGAAARSTDPPPTEAAFSAWRNTPPAA